MRLGLAVGRRGPFVREISSGVRAAAADFGWNVTDVRDGQDEGGCDVVLAIGNPSIYPELVRRPKRSRRVLWHAEPLFSRMPGVARVHEYLPTGRLIDFAAGIVPALARNARFRGWREDAAIVREPLANLVWLRRTAHAFDRIVMDSHGRARSASAAGLAVDVVPLGYHAAYAGALSADTVRDVDVLFFGRYISRFSRRQELLERLRSELQQRDTILEVVTGNLYGLDRRRALSAARIVVDFHRIPGNIAWHRFILASAAGAAVVTEPFDSPWPLEPGVHYLESSAARMADTIAHLLDDETARRRLVAAAQALLAGEMHMARVLPRVLGAASNQQPQIN